ncbi:hypothetical protein AVEN_92170-1 [Araneus ventricosus]|uniref:Uncharacterized protein n=1 Tax=Araneus ventricosus TaxID=182803 RepID=A0A4Y2GB73_ARAVE|nr:hypothetical protein AVEN_92170-1 [Araneus ventricosus]
MIAAQQIISSLRNSDVIWIYAKYKEVLQFPEWSGFMELLTQHEEHYKSREVYLPTFHKQSYKCLIPFKLLCYMFSKIVSNGHATFVISLSNPFTSKQIKSLLHPLRTMGLQNSGETRRFSYGHVLSWIGCLDHGRGIDLKAVLSTIYASNFPCRQAILTLELSEAIHFC